MNLLSAGTWLAACWLAASLDAQHVDAILWLTQCAQADPASKFLSVYSVSHGMAFPCSFSLMVLMSAWHLGRQSIGERGLSVCAGTVAMWLSMYPICLLSEQIAGRISSPVGVQIYAFLMLAAGSAVMLFFDDKNLFPERGTK